MGTFIQVDDAAGLSASGAQMAAVGDSLTAQGAAASSKITGNEAGSPWGDDEYGDGFLKNYHAPAGDGQTQAEACKSVLTDAGPHISSLGTAVSWGGLDYLNADTNAHLQIESLSTEKTVVPKDDQSGAAASASATRVSPSSRTSTPPAGTTTSPAGTTTSPAGTTTPNGTTTPAGTTTPKGVVMEARMVSTVTDTGKGKDKGKPAVLTTDQHGQNQHGQSQQGHGQQGHGHGHGNQHGGQVKLVELKDGHGQPMHPLQLHSVQAQPLHLTQIAGQPTFHADGQFGQAHVDVTATTTAHGTVEFTGTAHAPGQPTVAASWQPGAVDAGGHHHPIAFREHREGTTAT